MKFERKTHWEKIYKASATSSKSWYQSTPTTSLKFLKQFNIAKDTKIIDIGGGDSSFIDNLINLGYQNLTVLDISESAIDKAKKRLGEQSSKVKWIVQDVTKFEPKEKYDFWHDRATFHFLTQKQDISDYINIVHKNVNKEGILVIGTFSEKGPKKCSGLNVKQYSEASMTALLKKFFKKVKCITTDHKTPDNTIQNFIFCSFKKLIII